MANSRIHIHEQPRARRVQGAAKPTPTLPHQPGEVVEARAAVRILNIDSDGTRYYVQIVGCPERFIMRADGTLVQPQVSYQKAPPEARTCRYCEAPFEPVQNHQDFCSQKCRRAWHYENEKLGLKP